MPDPESTSKNTMIRSSIGKFPERLAPISHRPHLTDLKDAISYNEIFEQLTQLNLDIYTAIALHTAEPYGEIRGALW